ncbi:MAG: hypothetical protein ACLU3I_11260 [Acutalibacteraceae bacterium]
MNKLLVTPSEVNEKSKEVTNLKEHMMSHLESIKNEDPEHDRKQLGRHSRRGLHESVYPCVQSVNRRTRYALQQHANNLAQAASRYSELEDAQISEATNLDSTEIFSK